MALQRTWPLLALALILGCGEPSSSDSYPASLGHETLLVLKQDADAADRAWLDLLAARFGGFDVVPPDSLSATTLAARRRVIFPMGSCQEALPQAQLGAVERHLEAGGLVFLECPSEAWSSRLGLTRAEDRIERPLPWPQRLRSSQSATAALTLEPPERLRMPWRGRNYWPNRGPLGLPTPALNPAGRPLAWRITQGRGRWVAIGMHLGHLATELRMGTRDRSQIDAAVGRQWLARWTDAMLDDRVAARPWPRVWPAPFEADGCLVRPGVEVEGLGYVRGDALPSGTALPTRTAHGLALPLYTPADPDEMLGWLRANARGAHGALAVPTITNELESRAQETAHLILDGASFLELWSSRQTLVLDTDFDGHIYRIAWRGLNHPELAVSVPQEWNGFVFAGWSSEEKSVRVRRAQSHDRAELLFRLGADEGVLEVEYRPAGG